MTTNPARVLQVTQPHRSFVRTDAAAKTLSRKAREVEITTILYDQAAANAENLRQHNLMKIPRVRLEITVAAGPDVYEVGQVVTVKIPRFNLEAGRDFLITGLTVTPFANEVTLRLWG